MEIRSVSLVALPESAARPAEAPKRETVSPEPVAKSAMLDVLAREIIARQAPELPQRELRLDIDRSSGRVVGTILDKNSGDVVAQIPSEEILALLEKTREMLGPLVDQQA